MRALSGMQMAFPLTGAGIPLIAPTVERDHDRSHSAAYTRRHERPGGHRTVCGSRPWETGALKAALGGLEGLVFKGGISENAAEIREVVVRVRDWLRLRLVRQANQRSLARLASTASCASIRRIGTDENRVIARHRRPPLA